MSFIKDLFDEIRALLGKIPKRIRVLIANSLEVTTAIRAKLDSTAAILITDLIPGDRDNELREGLIHAIDQSMPYLMVVDACKDKPTTEEMIQCWIEQLRTMPKHTQDALLIKLAALLTAIQDKKELRQNLYDTYTQMQVSGNK